MGRLIPLSHDTKVGLASVSVSSVFSPCLLVFKSRAVLRGIVISIQGIVLFINPETTICQVRAGFLYGRNRGFA